MPNVLIPLAFTGVYPDYAALQAGIIDWSQREDLASQMPAFIELAERSMFRELPLRASESVLTGSAVGQTISLPAVLNAIERVELVSNGVKYTLTYTSPNGIEALSTVSLPTRFTVENGALRLIAPPAADYSYSIFYMSRPDFLTGSVPSNAVLAAHPDLYLWGALTELARYIMDYEMEGRYLAAYVSALGSVRAADERRRFPASGGLQIKPRSVR